MSTQLFSKLLSKNLQDKKPVDLKKIMSEVIASFEDDEIKAMAFIHDASWPIIKTCEKLNTKTFVIGTERLLKLLEMPAIEFLTQIISLKEIIPYCANLEMNGVVYNNIDKHTTFTVVYLFE